MSGHRQSYVCVVTDWGLHNGFRVVIAAGNTKNDGQDMTPLALTLQKKHVEYIQVIDWTPDVVMAIEREQHSLLTVFPMGDEILDLLSQMHMQSNVKRAAIFIRTNDVYRKSLKFNTLRNTIQEGTQYQKMRKAIKCYQEEIPDSCHLNVLLFTNSDFFSQLSSPRCHYLPEIYQTWGCRLPDTTQEIANLCAVYQNFLDRTAFKTVILFFGGYEARKGYDVLMKYVCDHPETVFVSCGRATNDAYRYDVAAMRTSLEREGRIFEQEAPFYADNRFIDLLFGSTDFVVLPYVEHYGLSGNLLKAASYGKPVVVPDIGWLQSTVRRYSVGVTYRHGNKYDMAKAIKQIKYVDVDFIANCSSLTEQFSHLKVREALSKALLPVAHNKS